VTGNSDVTPAPSAPAEMTRSVPLDAIADRLQRHGISVHIHADAPDVTVSGITHDSRSVERGQLFVCLRGENFDGHDFAAKVIDDGAIALLVDHALRDIAAPQLVVDDTRLAAGPAAAVAWGDPASRLTMVGITGTNGKTTVAHIVAALLEASGQPTGVIGTLHGPRTTPEAPDLHATLAQFIADDETAAVMEVSSHALALHRIDGTRFDVVAFTNFGHDHLDLHGSPEAYFRAKSALFTSAFAPVAVINVDDTHGRLLADTLSDRSGEDGDDAMRVVEVGEHDIADVIIGAASHSYTWRGRQISVPLGGDFNVANSLMALSIVAEILAKDEDGLDLAIRGLVDLEPVPGRFEIVESPDADALGIIAVVDYAHTPDGLERLLVAARRLTEQRVIAVFGCAGRRDREKRPVMGEVAGRLADVAIATSDNPRGEDPDVIIADVLAGVREPERDRVTAQPDRRLAISEALRSAQRGDIVVVAGKGHERTQDLGDKVVEFDDRDAVREELAAIRHDHGTMEKPA
jgi:UDP-N-acetylmuramoyl-L-alanyl-D-glutamate--2,6-diaminopimelate ligase